MSTRATPRFRIASPESSRIERLAIVFADPVRLKIVSELYRRVMSPSEFHAAYGGVSLAYVDRHFKRLTEHGWLRLVDQKKGGSRRGATENFYRATELAIFDNETWGQLPIALRTEFSWRIFEQFGERVKIAQESNTLDARLDRFLTWTPLVVDQLGRRRVISAADSLFEAMFEEEADSRTRLAESGEEPIHVTVAIGAFDSPNKGRNRTGLLLPTPSPDREASAPFGLRVAKVFSNPLHMKIVSELYLREMGHVARSGVTSRAA